MKPAKSENIESIQFLRGIAAFMVLLHHSVNDHIFPKDSIVEKICHGGWMGVNIFFIISGFIIPYSMFAKDYRISDFKSFFIKRIARIEPPYIISIVLALFLLWSNTLSPSYKGPSFTIDWGNVLGHLGYINAFTNSPWLNLAYWTLAIEFEYYIIIALTYPLMVSEVKWRQMLIFGALLLSTFLPSTSIPFLLPGKHIFSFFPFFVLGIALFLFQKQRLSVAEYFIVTAASLGLVIYQHSLMLFFISIATLSFIHFIRHIPKALLWLGTISYSLYLTHNVLITRYIALASKAMKNVDIRIIWFSGLVFCCVAAWLYYLLVEKPFINFSKRIVFDHNGAMKVKARKQESATVA